MLIEKKFGELLKKLRKEKGLTQKQLAEEINVTREIIVHWERGKGMPSGANLLKLSKYLGEEILTFNQHPKYTLPGAAPTEVNDHQEPYRQEELIDQLRSHIADLRGTIAALRANNVLLEKEISRLEEKLKKTEKTK